MEMVFDLGFVGLSVACTTERRLVGYIQAKRMT